MIVTKNKIKMSLGFGQIIMIVLLLFLLFGNIPNLFKDIALGINYLKEAFIEEKSHKKKINTPKK